MVLHRERRQQDLVAEQEVSFQHGRVSAVLLQDLLEIFSYVAVDAASQGGEVVEVEFAEDGEMWGDEGQLQEATAGRESGQVEDQVADSSRWSGFWVALRRADAKRDVGQREGRPGATGS